MEPRRPAHLDHRPAADRRGRAGGRRLARPARRRRLRAGADLAAAAGAARPRGWPGIREAEVDDDLAEWDYGDLEGRTTDADPRDRTRTGPIWTGPVPGGETRRAGVGPARPGGRPLPRRRRPGAASSGTATRCGPWRPAGSDLPVTDGRHLRLDTATVSVLGLRARDPGGAALELLTGRATLPGPAHDGGPMPLRAECPRCPTPIAATAPTAGWSCPDHGPTAAAAGGRTRRRTTRSPRRWPRPATSRRTCPGR